MEEVEGGVEEIEAEGAGAVGKTEVGGVDGADKIGEAGEGVAVAEDEEAGREEEKPSEKETARIGMKVIYTYIYICVLCIFKKKLL